MGIETKARSQCPECMDNGKDNLIHYKDGSHCHACGYSSKKKVENKMTPLVAGTCVEIVDRKLSLATCEHYNIRVKEYTGRIANLELDRALITLFPYYENGKVVKQKIRDQKEKKNMTQVGDTKCRSLFGQQAFNPTKKLPIVVTVGEYDAPSIYQITGLPAVSVGNGDGDARKQLLEQLEWLSQWREVLLCFDNDEPGQKAARECIDIFEPGTCKNITLPLKDANEMLKEGREGEIKKCINTAEIIRPSTIVFPHEILEDILTPPYYGTPWPWKFMTKVTYGNRLGEVYMLAGDTSMGKSQIVYSIVGQHLANGCKVGLIDLERQNAQTMQRILGNILKLKLHIPPAERASYPAHLMQEELEKLKDQIALYRPDSGKLTIESILINIRYLAKAYGINFFVLDNLTALSVYMPAGLKEHEFAAMCTGQLVHIAKELNVTIFIINHLIKAPVQLNADITMGDDFVYKPNKEGLSWESGRIPEINHIYGGGKVAKLPDFLIVCARNRMSEDIKEQRTIKMKFLKTRFDSEFEGHEFKLLYEPETGRLNEIY